jgi:hypothetical protein
MANLKFIGLLLLLLSVAGCGETAVARYRMTITVDDNGRLYSGSGVWEEKVVTGFFFPDVYSRSEAIPVKLGEKGTLFVLPAGRYRETPWVPTASENAVYFSSLFGERKRASRGEARLSSTYVEEIRNISKLTGQSEQIDCRSTNTSFDCPFMVTFGNLGDPQSVVAVDPANISKVFGAGVSLKPIVFKITKDPVTVGQASRLLPWLKQFNEKNFDGSDASYRDTSRGLKGLLGCGNFIEECGR